MEPPTHRRQQDDRLRRRKTHPPRGRRRNSPAATTHCGKARLEGSRRPARRPNTSSRPCLRQGPSHHCLARENSIDCWPKHATPTRGTRRQHHRRRRITTRKTDAFKEVLESSRCRREERFRQVAAKRRRSRTARRKQRQRRRLKTRPATTPDERPTRDNKIDGRTSPGSGMNTFTTKVTRQPILKPPPSAPPSERRKCKRWSRNSETNTQHQWRPKKHSLVKGCSAEKMRPRQRRRQRQRHRRRRQRRRLRRQRRKRDRVARRTLFHQPVDVARTARITKIDVEPLARKLSGSRIQSSRPPGKTFPTSARLSRFALPEVTPTIDDERVGTARKSEWRRPPRAREENRLQIQR